METQRTKPTQSQIAIMPAPGMGRLIPLVELAKRLVLQRNFLVIFIIPTDGSPLQQQKQLLEALPTSISTVFLPPVSFDDLPDDVRIEVRIALTITRSLSVLRDTLEDLTKSTGLVALVVDLFGTAAINVAKELGVPPYIFITTTAMELSLDFHLPEFDEKFSCEYRDLAEPIQLPGCVPLHGRDLMDPVQERKTERYKCFINMVKQYPLAAGIMVNSFMDLEPGAFKALMENESSFKPPVYPIGPLIQKNLPMRLIDLSVIINFGL